MVLSDVAEGFDKTINYYAPDNERCIIWDDPTIGIRWPIDGEPVLSAKDWQGIMFNRAECFE